MLSMPGLTTTPTPLQSPLSPHAAHTFQISGLMGLFASKVVEQQGGMEHVFDVAVSANDKVVRGGQHLEKAADRGGAFRLFYAYFMITASFCLLFLHFYRP